MAASSSNRGPRQVHSRRGTMALASGGLLALSGGTTRASARVAEVRASAGVVAVIRGTGILPLALGDDIFVDDIVRTGPESRLVISCTGGLQIAIGPTTELAVRTFLAGEPGGRLEVVLGLLQGIARLIGGTIPRGLTIEVDTRTAIASVRSTEWLLESTAKGTGVLSIEGEVTVLALAGGQVVLQPGQGTDVPPGGPPKAPATWGEARRRDAIARTTI